MNQSYKTKKLLINHYKKYPELKIQDIFKFLHQSSLGCEHLISSHEIAFEKIITEVNSLEFNDKKIIEELDGNYSRVSLGHLKGSLSEKTFARLFFLSAKTEPCGINDLEKKLSVARELAAENKLPFTLKEFDEKKAEWETSGYPAVHHSLEFNKAYHPSYRVIENVYVKYLSLFEKLDEMLDKKRVIVAIDGKCAGGKSTFSEILKKVYDCTVFHMDDFFLQPQQRTSERYAKPGENVDWERFLEEVLLPLNKNKEINYRKFDCSTLTLSESQKVFPKKLTVIEGTYSMHPSLRKYYDLSVFLDISPELQKERILKRNSPEIANRFFNEWIPLENMYFSELDIKEKCNMYFSS